EQCLFLLIGTGANGKSTFINALNHLFGDYAATVPMHTLTIQRSGGEQTNDLALLPGKRFVAASEGEPGQRLAESRIKLSSSARCLLPHHRPQSSPHENRCLMLGLMNPRH